MKFVGVKEIKQKTMDLLNETKKGDIIITAYGRPKAILHHITEEDLADYLIESDPSFRRKIETSFKEYLKYGGISAEELIAKLEKKLGKEKV